MSRVQFYDWGQGLQVFAYVRVLIFYGEQFVYFFFKRLLFLILLEVFEVLFLDFYCGFDRVGYVAVYQEFSSFCAGLWDGFFGVVVVVVELVVGGYRLFRVGVFRGQGFFFVLFGYLFFWRKFFQVFFQVVLSRYLDIFSFNCLEFVFSFFFVENFGLRGENGFRILFF